MVKVKHEIEVPKEAHEVGRALVGVAKSIKVAKADGWQPGTDVPAVLAASFQPLLTALDGVTEVSNEAKESPEGVVLAVACAIAEVYAELK